MQNTPRNSTPVPLGVATPNDEPALKGPPAPTLTARATSWHNLRRVKEAHRAGERDRRNSVSIKDLEIDHEATLGSSGPYMDLDLLDASHEDYEYVKHNKPQLRCTHTQ